MHQKKNQFWKNSVRKRLVCKGFYQVKTKNQQVKVVQDIESSMSQQSIFVIAIRCGWSQERTYVFHQTPYVVKCKIFEIEVLSTKTSCIKQHALKIDKIKTLAKAYYDLKALCRNNIENYKFLGGYDTTTHIGLNCLDFWQAFY